MARVRNGKERGGGATVRESLMGKAHGPYREAPLEALRKQILAVNCEEGRSHIHLSTLPVQSARTGPKNADILLFGIPLHWKIIEAACTACELESEK